MGYTHAELRAVDNEPLWCFTYLRMGNSERKMRINKLMKDSGGSISSR